MKTIEELEQYIKDGELLKVRIEDRLSNLQTQYKQNAMELQNLGIDVADAGNEIKKKEDEYVEGLRQLEQMLPIDIIDKYKNFNFADNTINNSSGVPF